MTKDDRNWLIWTLVAVASAIAITMGGLHFTGVLNGAGDNGTRLGAVLTFLAAVITATLSVVGFMAKRQADRRLEADHCAEQQRLRLDAAMRAGDLFSLGPNGAAEPARVASGLLALTQLGRADLAVALLVDFWHPTRDSSVSTETAILVLNAALDSSDPNTQLIAAEVLNRNAGHLDACEALHWPAVIDGRWKSQFGVKTKLLLVEALFEMTLTTQPNQNSLRSLALRLYGIWGGDPNPRVRGCIGRLINSLLPALERLGYTDFVEDPTPITLEEIREATKTAEDKNPDGLLERIVRNRIDRLTKWSNDCHITDMSAGSLASTVTGSCGKAEENNGIVGARPPVYSSS